MQMMMQAKAASSSSSSSSSSHSQHEESDHSHLQLALSLTLSPHPSSSQVVVGWPPLGPCRMNTYSSSHAKSPATQAFNSMLEKSKGNSALVTDSDSDTNSIVSKEKRNLISRNSLFVKVKMDGMPIGRKVDLSAHSSYETLAQTLEDMFNEPTTVLTDKGSNGEDHCLIVGADGQSKLLDGSSNFVLTYEDKEGDWMLVGDVPWWMFLSSVRRLRIMRTSECNGFAPSLEEKNGRLKSKPI